MPLAPGTRLGNFEILAPIGKGGMGEVYRAKDLKLGRDVAIKILPAAFAQFPDRLTRFEREAKVLAKLNHPNIATIYTVEESAEGKALVMELVPGAPVQGPLPLSQAIEYGRQIASAIEAAHEQGITHRDLKPANIMFRDGNSLALIDFGLAKQLRLQAAITGIGQIFGTPYYMSPEQAEMSGLDRSEEHTSELQSH